MKPSLLVFTLLLTLSACSTTPKTPTLLPSEYKGAIRVACVGDSITFGSGVEDANNYPAVLDRLLGEQFEVRNFGVSGATLLKKGDFPYWNTPQFGEVRLFEPHVIIIKLGTNDSKPQNWQHGADFAKDLRDMVEQFQKLPGKPKIWLCYPVPVYETRWGINDEIVRNQIISAIARVADAKKLPVIDLYAALSDRPEFFPDKIHPNAAGARRMAETVKAALVGY